VDEAAGQATLLPPPDDPDEPDPDPDEPDPDPDEPDPDPDDPDPPPLGAGVDPDDPDSDDFVAAAGAESPLAVLSPPDAPADEASDFAALAGFAVPRLSVL
jgi:hypothetical protein